MTSNAVASDIKNFELGVCFFLHISIRILGKIWSLYIFHLDKVVFHFIRMSKAINIWGWVVPSSS